MAGVKEQQLCITFSFIPRKAASETKDMKPGVNDTSQKPNSSLVSEKAISFDIWRKRSSSFEHQEHVGGFVFDCAGTVHQEMFLLAKMVIRRYYWEVLRRLRERVCRQHQEDGGTRTNWCTMTVRRCTLLVSLQQQFLAAEIMAMFPHPSFWFDFAPCVLFLFPRMKS